MSAEINLLQNSRDDHIPLSRNALILRGIALSLLFLVSFFSIMLFILIALSPLPTLQQTEKDQEKRISVFHALIGKLLLTKERLTQVNTLLQQRPMYADVLQSLEDQLPSGASLDSLRVERKKVLLTVSSSSLLSLDGFTNQLVSTNNSNKKFRSIILNSMYYEDRLHRYFMVMELNQL